MMRYWKGKRVLIIGAARQGQALARFLCTHGAHITLNDKQDVDKLTTARTSLQDLSINWITGGHPLEALESIDLVCISGGVPLNNPIIVEANRLGMPVSNDTQVFMEAVPCKVIGITGSAGKTTTTTLVGRIANEEQSAPGYIWVGGNIGNPLISDVDRMKQEDLVIMEVSSFQLEQMTISPWIAAVLNITPNHLDRHGTMEAYTAAKSRILAYQDSTDTAVLNRDDNGSIKLASFCKGKLTTFGRNRSGGSNSEVFILGSQIYAEDHLNGTELLDTADIALRGDHNLMNVLAACAICWTAGFTPESIQRGISDFSGVLHRLQFVREYHGARWYNDSIATAPERTMAALKSFEEPIILLAGGRDKDLPWEDFAALAHQRVSHLILFGEAADKIQAAMSSRQSVSKIKSIDKCVSLQEAVSKASAYARPGDVVLLSPGGTSFDEFLDFEQRGEAFSKWVLQLS